MDSDELFSELALVAKLKSNNSRINWLKNNQDDKLLKRVLKYALDPGITFGVTITNDMLANVKGSGTNLITDSVFAMLDALAKRDVTGNAALKLVRSTLQGLTPTSSELLARIIDKDLRCKIKTKTVKNAYGLFIKTYEVMKPRKYVARKIEYPAVVEPKLNGLRTLVHINPKTNLISFKSKVGNEFTSFGVLREHILKNYIHLLKKPYVLDCEVVSGSFNQTTSRVRNKYKDMDDAILYVFDSLPEGNFSRGFYNRSLLARRTELLSMMDIDDDDIYIKLVPQSIVFNEKQLDSFYFKCLEEGYEGIVVKHIDGIYECKESSNAWKRKEDDTVDGYVVQVDEGQKDIIGMLGSLHIVLPTGVTVRIGGGYSREQRKDIWESYLREPNSILGRYIEVSFQSYTEAGSLRHANFIRFRDSVTGEKE